MSAERDYASLKKLTDRDRTDYKRTVVKPRLCELGASGWDATEIAGLFAALLPYLSRAECAEVLAAVLARGEYHPFRDGQHPSDVVKSGFVLDAKSVQYRFSYKSRPDETARQVAAHRASHFLPGLVIVYQGKPKDHRVVFLPGLLRRSTSVTLNRVVDRPELWAWNRAKPVGILISQDRDNLTKFLTDPAHVSDALARMEAAMATAAKAFKNDPQMRKDLDEISQETMTAMLKTDLGQEALAAAEVRGQSRGRKEGFEEGEQAATRRIFQALRKTMPEVEARRITGYTGP